MYNSKRKKRFVGSEKQTTGDGTPINIRDKIRKRYVTAVTAVGAGGSVLLAVLERGNSGLGLSLAGHKDRARMAVLVCGLNPNGAAYKNGDIKVGDEILEVSVSATRVRAIS
ncbi:hypothetical protein ONE63_010450 [Megalurothrips usitatus]|uniref:PDZ domain-containing protein n=1 Tax=Megalurothrips usitatus TaxID=439358 RepID=A0AAV7XEX6_9NEOP|nr:hypothetical protein ONE63_010450 [Megalurothrips usitatus]